MVIHIIYIKHISRLLNLNAHTKANISKSFCPYCNKNIIDGDFFDNHIKDCYKRACGAGSLIKLPEKGSTMKFKNYKNQIERPYIIYADTESTLEKTDKDNLLHHHKTKSCCYYFVCNFDSSKNKLKTLEGDNCIENMIIELSKLSNKCIEEMRENEKLEMSKDDKKKFFDASCCSICNEPFKTDEIRCRDHDHRTGKFRGATSKM